MKNVVQKIKQFEDIELTVSYYFLTEKKAAHAKTVKVIAPDKDGTIKSVGGFYKPVSKIKISHGQ